MDTGIFNTNEDAYLRVLQNTLAYNTTSQKGRDGFEFYSGPPCVLTHHFKKQDDAYTFPLLTTKKMQIKNIAIELEFFLKGETNVKWLEERGCKIWSKWAKPDGELGPMYGAQWNKTNAKGISQLENVVNQLKRYRETEATTSRRLLVNAWNILELELMVLPPCHFAFQLTPYKIKEVKHLSITWYQRSSDLCIGVPYNLASYALLLLVFCKMLDFEPGYVSGCLGTPHIYKNQVDLLKEQVDRIPLDTPLLTIPREVDSYKNWDAKNIKLTNYAAYDAINYPITI